MVTANIKKGRKSQIRRKREVKPRVLQGKADQRENEGYLLTAICLLMAPGGLAPEREANMRGLKIDYRMEELFLKYGLIRSATRQRLARSSKNPGVIQKSKQISCQPKSD